MPDPRKTSGKIAYTLLLTLACAAIVLGPVLGTPISILNGGISSGSSSAVGNVGDTISINGIVTRTINGVPDTTVWDFFANYVIRPFSVSVTDVSANCVLTGGCDGVPLDFRYYFITDQADVTEDFWTSLDGSSTGPAQGRLTTRTVFSPVHTLGFGPTGGGSFSAGPQASSLLLTNAYVFGDFIIDSLGEGDTLLLPNSADIGIKGAGGEVPEPSTGVLAVGGLALLTIWRRRQVRRQRS